MTKISDGCKIKRIHSEGDVSMRMRKKKNQAERLASLPNLLRFTTDELRFDASVEGLTLSLSQLFHNGNPVHLEIGSGKGQFAVTLAKTHPDINVLAVEKTDKVILPACEAALAEGVTNLLFVNLPAEYLPRYLPENSIDRLYLNFSCPYPKHTYAGHRLTNPRFLQMYRRFLKPDGELWQKTDNRGLFEYSIEQLSLEGWRLKNISLDLHHSDFEGNIVTEYEEKFSSQGLPIYRLEAVKPRKG